MSQSFFLISKQFKTYPESVASEQLTICRLTNAGSPSGEGGYQINNFSREDRDVPVTLQPKSFSDSLFFEGGLLATWHDLADRFRQNTP